MELYIGGVAAAMMQKLILRTAPLGSYRVEFTAFVMAMSVLKNGSTTKTCITGMERDSDF